MNREHIYRDLAEGASEDAEWQGPAFLLSVRVRRYGAVLVQNFVIFAFLHIPRTLSTIIFFSVIQLIFPPDVVMGLSDEVI